MGDAICVSNLTKDYDGFSLENINFKLPEGSVVGLIGENGAGKTTLLELILGYRNADSGTVRLLGEQGPRYSSATKQRIGFLVDGAGYNRKFKTRNIDAIFSCIYKEWDSQCFFNMLGNLGIPPERRIGEMSRGMVVKLQIAVGFAYHPDLLIFDEATSGLDPVARKNLLAIVGEYVREAPTRSALLSTHIVSDLEGFADRVLYIHNGVLKVDQALDRINVSLENLMISTSAKDDSLCLA